MIARGTRAMMKPLTTLAFFALGATGPVAQALVDVTGTHLPAQRRHACGMAGVAADLDGDGDLDLAIAREYAPNVVLFHDGNAYFADVSGDHLSPITGDHEDVVAADFDGDGDLDL